MSQSSDSAINYNLPLAVAPDKQVTPILIEDDKGGAFSFWQDHRDDHAAIYAQYLNDLSQPIWKQNGIVAASSTRDQLMPAAIADGKGGVLIFWQDRRHDEGDIYGQHLDRDGNLLWSQSGAAVIRASGKQTEPQAASDGQGGAFVVCRDFKSGKEDIIAQRIDRNGKTVLEAAGKAIAHGKSDQILGAITATPDGGFVVAWSDDWTGAPRVTAQRFDAEVNPQWSTSMAIVVTRSAQTAPAVYVSANSSEPLGSTFIVWRDTRNRHLDLYAQKIDAGGWPHWSLWGVPVCTAKGDQYNQQIIGDGNGGILVVWEDRRLDNGDIYGQRLNGAGQNLWAGDGVGIAVANREQSQPAVIADGSGGLICAWVDERGAGINVAAQRLDYGGKALWATDGIPITNGSGHKQRPAILARAGSFLGKNGSLLAWEDTRNGHEDIFAQPLKGDGAFANVPPRIISSPATEAYAGRFYAYSVQAIDYDSSDPLSLELVAAPQWLQIEYAKMQLFGTPTSEVIGEADVALIVKDKLGAGAGQSFTLKVLSSNHPPLIASQADTLAIEDQAYSYQIVAVDPDSGDALTFAMETDADWLELTSEGKITGTPANEHVGSYLVTASVTDSERATATQKFPLYVQNVNDPPFFISQPDTVAYVDSLYTYRIIAQDVDAEDEVQIVFRRMPGWLSWDTGSQTLQGKPDFRQAGAPQPVNLLARDVAGDSAAQSFRLHVRWHGASDTTAPSAPQAVQIQPAQWSSNKKFVIRWQNPFDPSHIAGAFYKIGAPPRHDRDGTFVPSASEPATAQAEILASQEGMVPVYLWLMDGRGNVNFRSTATVTYRYDATPPQSPSNLLPHRQWSRGDSVRFRWNPARDAASSILRYHFFLDNEFFGYIAGDTSGFTLILQLDEKAFTWKLLAEDSAGNRSKASTAAFQVDRTAPTLHHMAADTATALTELSLAAQAQDDFSGIRDVRLYYRAAGESSYRVRNMQNTNNQTNEAFTFVTRIEGSQVVSKGLEYYLEAADSAGNRVRWPAADYHAIVVASSNVAAPAPFVAGRYQIFSVPYNLLSDAPADLLEDDLGNYDPTTWRLFRYQPGEGNVEFGEPNLDDFAPGRAFWLITAGSQNFDAGPGYSVRTNKVFALILQPGWNLIATPFDFPTAWSAVKRPAGVENNLWAFDGTRYAGQQEVMMPWQGYFVRNLEAQPQTIKIFPIAGPRAPKAARAAFGTRALSAAEIFWQVQLCVSDGEFGDDENYLGVAAPAVETWDPFDLSEPPTIGDFVALYFDRRDWQHYPGLFTSDFRPPGDEIRKWPFRVVASRPGKKVELSWEFSGDLPKDWIFILEDVNGRTRRQIPPQTSGDGASGRYVFRSTPEPREFIWWAGRKENLAESGALQNYIPAAFELAPSFPNPIRMAASSQSGNREIAAIRFGLPTPASVQLTIFDTIGRKVRTLVAGQKLDAGYHEMWWDGRDEEGRPASAGIYMYLLEASTFRASRKLVLLR